MAEEDIDAANGDQDEAGLQSLLPAATDRPERFGERPRRIRPQEPEIVIHQGPLPRPEDLREYDEIVVGGAERIMQMAERQAAHRQSYEKTALNADIFTERLGMILGFILAAMTLVGGLVLLGSGKQLVGFGTVLIGAGLLIGSAIYNKQSTSQKPSEGSGMDALPSTEDEK